MTHIAGLTTRQQSLKKWSELLAYVLLFSAFAVFAIKLIGVGGLVRSDVPVWAKATVLGGAALLIAAVIFLMRRHWKFKDEAVREAHKSAWFWGGSFGVLLVLPLVAAFVLSDWRLYGRYLAFLHLGSGFGEFMAGIVTTLLCMMTGYVAAWAFWWWKRR